MPVSEPDTQLLVPLDSFAALLRSFSCLQPSSQGALFHA